MGLATDPNVAWRSASMSGIKVVHSKVHKPIKGAASMEVDHEVSVTDRTIDKWLGDLGRFGVNGDEARVGMVNGTLHATIEVSTTGQVMPDGAISLEYVVPYDYSQNNTTRVHLSHSGKHFKVRPEMNSTVVKAMYSSPSSDDWVKAAGIKLPRVTNSHNQPNVVPDVAGGSNSNISTAFEGLRREAAQHAKTDDYGLRLHSLARVVCHTVVASTVKKRHGKVSAMLAQNVSSMLSSDTPSLTSRQLNDYCWAYTHTDDTDIYRAFLLMGLRGLEHYVGKVATCYSQCVTEPEASFDDAVVFVRVGGDMTPQQAVPAASAYLEVLNNPQLAVSLYYAYALSMGIGAEAAAVLVQTAVGPHIWLDNAISPYKNCRPKLDACRYVINPNEARATVMCSNISQVVHQAAIVGAAVKAGLGALATGFESKSDTDSTATMGKVMSLMASQEASNNMVKAINQCLLIGNAGLEWISPIAYSVRDGFAECVKCWRQQGCLLSIYRQPPLSVLTPLLGSGVDMSDAILGSKTTINGAKFVQLVACELATGAELSCMCEKPTRATLHNVHDTLSRLRQWKVVITLTRLHSGGVGDNAEQDTPPSAKTRSSAKSSSSNGSERRTSTVVQFSEQASSEQAIRESRRPRVDSNDSDMSISERVRASHRARSLSPPLPVITHSINETISERLASEASLSSAMHSEQTAPSEATVRPTSNKAKSNLFNVRNVSEDSEELKPEGKSWADVMAEESPGLGKNSEKLPNKQVAMKQQPNRAATNQQVGLMGNVADALATPGQQVKKLIHASPALVSGAEPGLIRNALVPPKLQSVAAGTSQRPQKLQQAPALLPDRRPGDHEANGKNVALLSDKPKQRLLEKAREGDETVSIGGMSI